MGRTILTAAELLKELKKDLKPFHRTIHLPDQLELDSIYEELEYYRAAISCTGTVYPLEVMLVAMVLIERKHANEIEKRLNDRIDQLIESRVKDGSSQRLGS